MRDGATLSLSSEILWSTSGVFHVVQDGLGSYIYTLTTARIGACYAVRVVRPSGKRLSNIVVDCDVLREYFVSLPTLCYEL